MAFVATLIKKIEPAHRPVIEIFHYTKLTTDHTGTIVSTNLNQVTAIDLASGASGAAARTAGSAKSFDLSGMGNETSGVIILEGNDL
jgi:hypothetical protein